MHNITTCIYVHVCLYNIRVCIHMHVCVYVVLGTCIYVHVHIQGEIKGMSIIIMYVRLCV